MRCKLDSSHASNVREPCVRFPPVTPQWCANGLPQQPSDTGAGFGPVRPVDQASSSSRSTTISGAVPTQSFGPDLSQCSSVQWAAYTAAAYSVMGAVDRAQIAQHHAILAFGFRLGKSSRDTPTTAAHSIACECQAAIITCSHKSTVYRVESSAGAGR